MKGLVLIIMFILISCGTETGNPLTEPQTSIGEDSPSTKSGLVLSVACNKLYECYSGYITLSNCEIGIFAQDNFDTVLGLIDGIYLTASEIVAAEVGGKISGNQNELSQCLTDINSLSCSDNEVVNSFDINSSTDYSNAFQIIPTGAGSCNDIFN
jgi:hypothetical protein